MDDLPMLISNNYEQIKHNAPHVIEEWHKNDFQYTC